MISGIFPSRTAKSNITIVPIFSLEQINGYLKRLNNFSKVSELTNLDSSF